MQNSKKTIEIIPNILALFVIGTVIAFTIFRLFLGAELTDEAYTAAETYMVSKGALPFINNWSQMPGFTLLLAPFIKLFTLISGGTEGIILFCRFLFFFINSITAFTVAYLFRNHIQSKILLSLIVIIYVGASGLDYVYAFRGDSLAIDLSAIGVALIISYFSDNVSSIKYLFVSGILLALSVLSYPTFILVYAYLTIAILILCRRKKLGNKGFLSFIFGSVVSASVVILYLSIMGGFTNIFAGLNYIFKDVTYFQIANTGLSKLPDYIKTLLSQALQILELSSISLVIFLLFSFIISRLSHHCNFLKRISNKYIQTIFQIRIEKDLFTINFFRMRQIILASILFGICLYHLKLILLYKTGNNTFITFLALSAEALAVLFLLPFISTEKKVCKYLIGMVWLPIFTWIIITGIGTFATMISRHQLLKNASFLLGVFCVFAVKDVFVQHKEEKSFDNAQATTSKSESIAKTLLSIIMMVVSFTYLFNAYSYVYRDDSFRLLDTVIKSGPYKGIYTTEARAYGLTELDKILDRYIDSNDYVLAMDNDPFIYLMSEGHICAPSTWDMALYSYGFDQPELYYDYFKVTNSDPTKIIYFDYGRDETLSIDTTYKFNDYVRNNFILIHEDRHIFEWNYCGKDITCQLLVYERKDNL